MAHNTELPKVRPDGAPYPVQLDDEVVRGKLDALSYAVLRRAGTERAGTGEYTDTETTGVYRCKACDAELFRSDAKFHSGCGWPSFYAPTEDDAVVLLTDHDLGYPRTEVRCGACGCINSVALTLEPTLS
jgi:peptide-methionine (R)-S-oxide reductase